QPACHAVDLRGRDGEPGRKEPRQEPGPPLGVRQQPHPRGVVEERLRENGACFVEARTLQPHDLHRGWSLRTQAALISMILNFRAPRGANTSTISPFFLPMIALPTGDSFESLFSAGFASAEPTVRYSNVLPPRSMSLIRTCEPIETVSFEISFFVI